MSHADSSIITKTGASMRTTEVTLDLENDPVWWGTILNLSARLEEEEAEDSQTRNCAQLPTTDFTAKLPPYT